MKRLSLVATAIVLLASGAAQAVPTYSVIGIPAIGGGNYNQAFGINKNGDVVGWGNNGAGATHAFLYSNGTTTDLGLATPNIVSEARGINDSGVAVGKAEIYYSTYERPALFSNGVTTDLGHFPGVGNIFSRGVAHDINASGMITGYSAGVGGYQNAFRYDNGVMTNLGTLGYGISAGYGINGFGHVVGMSFVTSTVQHAFLYDSSMHDLGTLPGGNDSVAYDINASGQVVGWSETTSSDSSRRAFLYSGGVMTNLGALTGTLSEAYGINNRGQVVGKALGGPLGGSGHAFLYSNGVMSDLNSLIDPLSGWTIIEAQDINNSGQIAAWGSGNGGVYALLLNPVPIPEPETYALMLAGLGLVGGMAWRRKGAQLHQVVRRAAPRTT